MISGHGNLDTAVAAVREGAVDFIEKPFEAERLIYLVDRATETERMRRENATLRQQVGHEEELHGSSVAINTVRATLKRVAPTGSRVLITGPAGVGKEIAARMIHNWSPRAKAPFVVLPAAMMSPDRVEEELFGSEDEGVARPGPARTCPWRDPVPRRDRGHAADDPGEDPARADRPELSPGRRPAAGQGRRPRALGDVAQPVGRDFRPAASARTSIYRLNVVPVRLPPLRERREDIPELVSHFLARFAAERRMPPPSISDEAMAALQAHDWPGNVRQLRNIIERTIILAPGDRVSCIEVDLLPPEILDNQNAVGGSNSAMAIMGSPLREARESFEREYLKIQIRRFSGNISRTASFIGMERSALHRKLKALGHRRQAGGRRVGGPRCPPDSSACRTIS